ncbi:hypothetical protein AB0M61_27140 [Streptomyces sp. NPDC051642]|uniref:hypothetical protein n=1 Tax=Streptomyces sp. NPDC051642 TaxID=3154646 RepID=UPI0034385453
MEVDVRDDLGDQESGGVRVVGVAGDLEEEGDEVPADFGAGGGVGGAEAVDLGSVYLGAEAQLNRYRMLLDFAERSSLSEAESRQLIRHLAREL